MSFDLDLIHEAAIEIAEMGGRRTLDYFRKSVKVERKSDDSPVTAADREAEWLMREEILNRFPSHGILGEEHGTVNEESSIQWILDPIDGTKSFIHGVPLYTTLIGVVSEGEPIIGVIFAPALQELCEAATGKGARLNGEACHVRSCSHLSDATFLSTDCTTASKFDFERTFKDLVHGARVHRTWGDAYGHMLVATGRADLMFDPILNVWDAAPLLPILQEAGGIYCDVTGEETIKTGNGISCNRELIKEVLALFDSDIV